LAWAFCSRKLVFVGPRGAGVFYPEYSCSEKAVPARFPLVVSCSPALRLEKQTERSATFMALDPSFSGLHPSNPRTSPPALWLTTGKEHPLHVSPFLFLLTDVKDCGLRPSSSYPLSPFYVMLSVFIPNWDCTQPPPPKNDPS